MSDPRHSSTRELTFPDVATNRPCLYAVTVPDRALLMLGIQPGDQLLVSSWMLDVWEETRFIGKTVLTIDRNDRPQFGLFYPPALVQHDGQLVLSELELVAVVEAYYLDFARGQKL